MKEYRLKTDSEDFGKDTSFGKVLNIVRLTASITMKELSTYSSVSQSYISQLENDTRLPSEDVIHKIAHAITHMPASSTDETISEEQAAREEEELFEALLRVKKRNEAKKHIEQLSKDIDYKNIFNSSHSIAKLDPEIQKQFEILFPIFINLSSDMRDELITYAKYLLKNK